MSKMKPINGILDINIAIRENKEVGIGVWIKLEWWIKIGILKYWGWEKIKLILDTIWSKIDIILFDILMTNIISYG
jgi:hypothetical protein